MTNKNKTESVLYEHGGTVRSANLTKFNKNIDIFFVSKSEILGLLKRYIIICLEQINQQLKFMFSFLIHFTNKTIKNIWIMKIYNCLSKKFINFIKYCLNKNKNRLRFKF